MNWSGLIGRVDTLRISLDGSMDGWMRGWMGKSLEGWLVGMGDRRVRWLVEAAEESGREG